MNKVEAVERGNEEAKAEEQQLKMVTRLLQSCFLMLTTRLQSWRVGEKQTFSCTR